MFGERCELRKGLAMLDTQERQLNWKIGSRDLHLPSGEPGGKTRVSTYVEGSGT